MGNFEELKENLIRKMNNYNMLPDEVLSILDRIFDMVQQVYSDYGALTMSIEDYIQGEIANINYSVNKLSSEKRSEQLTDLKSILNRMEQELEEELQAKSDERSEEDETKQEQQHKQEIEGIDRYNETVTVKIIGQLEDSLNSIRSTANRIMSSRGISSRDIEEINYQIKRIMYRLPEQQEQIFAVLQADDANMLKMIIDEYDNYLSQNRMTEHKKFVQKIKVEEDELIPLTPKTNEQEDQREQSKYMKSIEDMFL